LTPITNIGASFDGAVIMTFLAPPVIWALAESVEVNTPVASTTYSAPEEPQGMASGLILKSYLRYRRNIEILVKNGNLISINK
jgi:hypothetical protein